MRVGPMAFIGLAVAAMCLQGCDAASVPVGSPTVNITNVQNNNPDPGSDTGQEGEGEPGADDGGGDDGTEGDAGDDVAEDDRKVNRKVK